MQQSDRYREYTCVTLIPNRWVFLALQSRFNVENVICPDHLSPVFLLSFSGKKAIQRLGPVFEM